MYVLESGHGIPSRCNEQGSFPGGEFAANNPFTPDILVFNKNGQLIRGPIGKPTASGDEFQPAGPAIDIAFARAFKADGSPRPTPIKQPTLADKTTVHALSSWTR